MTVPFQDATTSEALPTQVSQTGGAGAYVAGYGPADAGDAIWLANAVGGETNRGILNLSQSATGGAGGASYDQGASGGAATSTLAFSDKGNATRSLNLSVIATAVGGAAGSPSDVGDLSGRVVAAASPGGSALAQVLAVGVHELSSVAEAIGGAGGGDETAGAGVSDIGGLVGGGAAGGWAKASDTATGAQTGADVVEIGGDGGDAAGAGYAAGAGGSSTPASPTRSGLRQPPRKSRSRAARAGPAAPPRTPRERRASAAPTAERGRPSRF
jgi:hypothetical protein